MKWLEDHGCEWVKVCAEPGDLLLWDSRTPHYNVSAEGNTPRFVVYTCYMPVKDATQEELIRKKEAYECKSHYVPSNSQSVVGKMMLTQDPVQLGSEPLIGPTARSWEITMRNAMARTILITVMSP